MITMIHPYRRAILNKLPKFCRSNKTSAVVIMDVKPAENGQPLQERL
jgi:hypothetical protein